MQRTRKCWAEDGSLNPRDATDESGPAPESCPSTGLSRVAREAVERTLGYSFRDPELLVRALTHSSRAHEEGDTSGGNERLEFLGDAVLDLVIGELLMELRPSAREGELSRARAAAVNQTALAQHARELGVEQYIRLGRGELQSGGSAKPSIQANLFEALIGALYLDGGLEPARRLVEAHVRPALAARVHVIDAKTRLQELLQSHGRPLPEYLLTQTEGPDHAREFSVEVRAGEECLGSGRGRSKREAEQAAAAQALSTLGARA